ncbi:hypothetical protein [Streptomyces sp. MMG1533]|uniref:hypothetical protein n=1 Tax=Streptomyces sp. MMG1533 TaxID=1415546 RepID=UPI000AB2DCBD|nr:hypothetical protein [Streptomyces sp. MMG1533]
MSAPELAEPYPSVCTDEDTTDAARLPTEQKLPAPPAADRVGQPYGSYRVPDYALERAR